MLTAAQKSGPVPAAGWITAVQAKDDGLWGKVQWTAQAAQLLKDRAYRYVSAVFDHMPDGRVVRLKGAGLVHAPNLPLQAAASQQQPLPTTIPTTGATMTLEEALAHIEALKTKLQSAQATVAAQSQQITTLTQTAAQSSAATPDPKQWIPLAQYQMVCAQLTTAQQSQAQSAVDEAVTAAMSEGKVAPALRQWATDYARQDLAGFQAFVASSPVVVAAQAQTIPAATGGVTTAAQALNDSDREIAKLLGLPVESMAAQKANAR
jgi:phage I-like protein